LFARNFLLDHQEELTKYILREERTATSQVARGRA
jgi:hypothetical protein